MNFLKNFDKFGGQLASEGTENDFIGYLDTGSYALNLLISGKIFGGWQRNKLAVLAGESSTGKTYLLVAALKAELEANPDSVVIYMESEGSMNKEFLEERGLDTSRVSVLPVDTVENWSNKITNILDSYIAEKKKPFLMMALDSVGNLASEKEVNDTTAGENKVDMTRAKKLKSAFRVICLKLAKAKIPLLVTNHTYDGMGMFASKTMSGGSGLRYNASNVIFLSKRKEKDGTEVTGNIITVTNNKSRYGRENKKIECLIDYTTGLSRYHGLLDLCIKYGIWTKDGKKFQVAPDKLVTQKEIKKNPTLYFTKEILEKIDELADEFRYSGPEILDEQEDD